MKRIFFSVLILALLFAPGCKKKTTTAKIKSLTDPVKNEVYTYQYNTNGSLNSVYGSLGDYSTYLNMGSYIAETDYNNRHVISGNKTYFLNSQNLADSIADVAVSGLNFYYKNAYNSGGYLVSQAQYDSHNNLVNTINYSITNGNYTREAGTGTLTVNSFSGNNNSIGYSNTGQYFLGKDSKNLLSSSNTTGTGQVNYSYTFDSQGRVTSSTLNNITYSSSSTYYYTYY